MSTTPLITVFVRHKEKCKYAGDEFTKRCSCKKHLRWTQNGTQHRRAAGTRSWLEADEAKRDLEDQLSGRSRRENADGPKTIEQAVQVFLQDKKVQGVTAGVLGKYTRGLDRLGDFCERSGVFTFQGMTREDRKSTRLNSSH